LLRAANPRRRDPVSLDGADRPGREAPAVRAVRRALLLDRRSRRADDRGLSPHRRSVPARAEDGRRRSDHAPALHWSRARPRRHLAL